MSWAALPVEPACMGKVGEGTRRPPMFVGLTEDECRKLQSFRINNKIIKAVACQTVIRNDICSKCCFVDTNICSNMRCFSSVREDDKSVILRK